MRLSLLTSAAFALALALPGMAFAINEDNREQLEEYFKGRGQVIYELYTPLGGPEIGGALVAVTAESVRQELLICRVDGRSVDVLMAQPVTHHGNRPPFTFLQLGRHLMTYPTMNWIDEQGQTHQRGDLQIFDMTVEGAPQAIFKLQDVLDLAIGPAGSSTSLSLIWQPRQHFLNTAGQLPLKYSYNELVYDEASRQYELQQHLETLPDAANVDSANLNNRAIFFYEMGNLMEAASLLERASIVAESDQSVILHNQAMVKGEMEELAGQGKLRPELPYDEARMYFFQGDYTAVIRLLADRAVPPTDPDDLAMLGISLAQKKRWPEADGVTVQLGKLSPEWLPDYCYEVARIAHYQGFDDIASGYLKVLEMKDRDHPGLAAGMAMLTLAAGQSSEARSLLEQYLSRMGSSPRRLQPARALLFGIYYASGDSLGCERLVREATSSVLADISDITELSDYADLSGSFSDVPLDTSDRIKAPEKPLDAFQFQED